MELVKLFFAALKINLIGFGGGPAMSPLVEEEFVKKRNLIDNEEFIDIVILSNSLPGPSIVEMLVGIGWKKYGALGALVCFFATCLPVTLVFLISVYFYNKYQNIEVLEKISKGTMPFILALLISLIYKLFKTNSKKLNIYINILVILTSFCLVYFLKMNIGLLMILSIAILFLKNLILKKFAKDK